MCDGTDRHILSARPAYKAIFVVVAIGLTAATVASGSAVIGAIAVASWISSIVVLSTSVVLDGDVLTSRRFGPRRQTPLREITRLTPWHSSGMAGLRTLCRDGSRGPFIPVRSSLVRLDPAAGSHLRRYLDRTDVAWDPSAWQMLGGAVGSGPASGRTMLSPPTQTPPGQAAAGPTSPTRPSWTARIVRSAAVHRRGPNTVIITLTTVIVVVMLAFIWPGTIESQTIQSGPEVRAAVSSAWVTSTSGRYGTTYTSHFAVTFTTLSGRVIAEDISAPGQLSDGPLATALEVRYDPGAPTHAEVAGDPVYPIREAWFLTAIGAVCLIADIRVLTTAVKLRRHRRDWALSASTSAVPTQAG